MSIAESLLHDVPLAGRPLPAKDYRDQVLGRLEIRRDLRLAVYEETVAWAAAAHDAGFDGLEWMSTRCNNARAQVLFGDRVAPDDLRADASYGRAFLLPEHFGWLVDMCAPLHVEVLPPH